MNMNTYSSSLSPDPRFDGSFDTCHEPTIHATQSNSVERAFQSTSAQFDSQLSYDEPSASVITETETESESAVLSKALGFTKNLDLPIARISRLESPIAIPQTAPGLGKSFVRAWAPILQHHSITVSELIAFIDNLNVISTASPPLQVLDLAGGFVGMVPHHWAQLTGTVIQGTAKLGTALVSKSRTQIYMREVNEKMFRPRGLKVSLASTEEMRAVLKIERERPTLIPLTTQTTSMSFVERALKGVEPYNAALDLHVPPQSEQTTVLAKLCARQVQTQERRRQKKDLKHREKDIKKEDKQKEKDKKKAEKRRMKSEKKEEKRLKKGKNRSEETDSDSSSDESRVVASTTSIADEKGDKQEKSARKLVWILIQGLEM